MINTVFRSKRKGLLGSQPMGADYMAGVEARARMLRRACRVTDDDPQPDDRQLRLPLGLGAAPDGQDGGECCG